jgi:hypothetical protein
VVRWMDDHETRVLTVAENLHRKCISSTRPPAWSGRRQAGKAALLGAWVARRRLNLAAGLAPARHGAGAPVRHLGRSPPRADRQPRGNPTALATSDADQPDPAGSSSPGRAKTGSCSSLRMRRASSSWPRNSITSAIPPRAMARSREHRLRPHEPALDYSEGAAAFCPSATSGAFGLRRTNAYLEYAGTASSPAGVQRSGWSSSDRRPLRPARLPDRPAPARGTDSRPRSQRSQAPAAMRTTAAPLQADPARDGTHSSTFILLDLARRLVLIGGTSHAGEIKKSVFSVMNYPPARCRVIRRLIDCLL